MDDFSINIYKKNIEQYKNLQKFIIEKYDYLYAAKTIPNPDIFVSLESGPNELKGACFGISFANNNKLFSEQYINGNIEDVLTKKTGKIFRREEFAELSSFFSVNSHGLGKTLAKKIPTIMQQFHVKYMLVTATESLRKIITDANLKFEVLTVANPNKICSSPTENWGNYYDKNPKTGIIVKK